MSFTSHQPAPHMSFREAPRNEGHAGNFFSEIDFSSEHISAAKDGIHMPAFSFDPIDPTGFDPLATQDFSRESKWDADAPAMPRFGDELGPKRSHFAAPAPNSAPRRVVDDAPALPVFKA